MTEKFPGQNVEEYLAMGRYLLWGFWSMARLSTSEIRQVVEEYELAFEMNSRQVLASILEELKVASSGAKAVLQE